MKKCLLLSSLALFAVSAQAGQMKTSFYGYIDAYYENVDDSPSPNSSTKTENAGEFDVPNINVIVQSTKDNTKAFLNVSGGGGGNTSVNNAWIDYSKSDALAVRFGKMYRPFGLYNEILDAVPTYIGIEPPELFDSDHQLLTRETNFMLHGKVNTGDSSIRWSLTTGNDDKAGKNNPVGADIRWESGTKWKIGSSFYTTGGYITNPDGTGGSTQHMTEEKYSVTGIYAQYRGDNITVQLAGYVSPHEGTRNTSTYCGYSSLDDFRKNRAGCNSTPIAAAEYDVETYYMRVGYDVALGDATLTPYFQYDYFKNEEIPFSKDDGGDKEAGLSNNGAFTKVTVGAVYRPDFNLALKFDYSQHIQDVDTNSNGTVDGSAENYGEYRVSMSYFWRL